MTGSIRRRRGFTLIEVMVSMAILAIGILGVAQVQILAANQNGIARRTARAAEIARDFSETAQRWEYTDPRLAATACNVAPAVVSDEAMGGERVPNLALDFTATPVAGTNAAAEGLVQGALELGGLPYDGVALIPGTNKGLLGDSERDQFQLLWSVAMVDLNSDPALPDCEAKQVTVVVRYPLGFGTRFRNVVTTFLKYDSRELGLNGVPEQF